MTNLTSPQLNELTEIVTGAPVSRAPTKGKAVERFTKAAEAQGLDAERILAMPFGDAKAILIGGGPVEDDLPESEITKRVNEIQPGSGGPGLARLRAHKDYGKITQQTQDEAAAVLRGEDPFKKAKKPRAAKPAAAEPKPVKATRSKVQPDHLIDSVIENPKRPGTKAHAIFACYKNGQTVAQFVRAVEKAGFTEADARSNIAWDSRKEFIRVSEAA